MLDLLLAVPVGALVGLSLGALGGGGSILTVPALVYLLGQDAHGATTTSLVIVGVTALAGSAAHARAGRVRAGKGLVFGALGVAGSFAGSRLSSGIGTNVLLGAFSGLLLVAAGAMARRSRQMAAHTGGTVLEPVPLNGTRGPEAGDGPEATARPVGLEAERAPVALAAPTGPAAGGSGRYWAKVVAAASVVGLLTGFFGVGGGFVVVPALVLALGLAMPAAVGTSLLVIAINSAAALVSRVGTHPRVDWSLAAVFVVAAVAGSVFGNRVASRTRPERLGLAFSLLLVGVAFYTAARSLPHLW